MKNYSIGLDIGTTSVGWACVNLENYKVLKRGSKSLWGVRLFEEATPALDRRLKRSTRRRYDRRRDRIRLLQEEFEEEMNKVDSNFFKKLKDSFYSEKDKENSFIKFNLEDKEIYNKYKTIYHLRNELMETNEKKDIRHIYLAIHHILKYRGNFNYEGKFNIDKIDILEGIKNLFDIIYNLTDKVNIEDVCDDDYKKIEKILLIENKKDCEKLLKEELKKYIEKDYNEIGNMILGNKFSIIKLFEIEDNEIDKISFKDSNLEENFEKLANILNEKIEILGNALELYNMLFLKHLFKGDNKTLSSLMIDKYNNHHKDLSLLKNLIRNDKQEYKKIFKSSKDKKIICYYDKYISNNISYEDFVKELNKVLDKVKDNDIEKYNIIKEKIENKTLLTKITNVDNGKFPVQLNEMELIKIIENQGKYYPFLKNKINDEYKLLKLLKFKIPYYVGPLNSKNSLNAWIERDYNIKITPYNFDEVVDKEKTAEKFIKRMLGHCTYLKDEIAMPLNSILYSKFKVLQELKQIKINDIKLTNEQINDIYNNLFLKVSRITEKKFIDYIKTSKEFDIYNNIEVKGYSSDKKFASDMQSYIDLKELIDIYSIDKIEIIIELITIF